MLFLPRDLNLYLGVHTVTKSRRTFLCALGTGAMVLPLSNLTRQGVALAAESSKVDPESPAAKVLEYVHESPNPLRRCADCQLFKGSRTAKWGRCALLAGKLVNARGWCHSWSG